MPYFCVPPIVRQLMLEPHASTGNMAGPSASAHMSPSSPLPSSLSTPTHSETHNTPDAGLNSSLPTLLTSGRGGDSRASGAEGEGMQLWRPSIRFVWSPSCSTQPGITSAWAAATSSVTPPKAGRAHPISICSSVCSSDSAAEEQVQGLDNSGGSKGQILESVTNGAGCVTKQSERKLLPSSWSIRKKNLAPASYRAAYQAQLDKDTSAAAADAELVPQDGSTEVTLPARAGVGAKSVQGDQVSGVSSASGGFVGVSSSGWQLKCHGRLSVSAQANSVVAAPAVSSGKTLTGVRLRTTAT
jgi:hypothetical protein